MSEQKLIVEVDQQIINKLDKHLLENYCYDFRTDSFLRRLDKKNICENRWYPHKYLLQEWDDKNPLELWIKYDICNVRNILIEEIINNQETKAINSTSLATYVDRFGYNNMNKILKHKMADHFNKSNTSRLSFIFHYNKNDNLCKEIAFEFFKNKIKTNKFGDMYKFFTLKLDKQFYIDCFETLITNKFLKNKGSYEIQVLEMFKKKINDTAYNDRIESIIMIFKLIDGSKK